MLGVVQALHKVLVIRTMVKWKTRKTWRRWSVLMVPRNKNPKKEDVIRPAIKWRRWSVMMVIRNKIKKEDVVKRKIKGQ
jgi:hypothetical protein